MFVFSKKQRGKTWERKKRTSSHFSFEFSERESSLSLKVLAIRPSTVFGTRRRTALRGKGFVWVPNLESFFKLREVGVSPYLGFYSLFKYHVNVSVG